MKSQVDSLNQEYCKNPEATKNSFDLEGFYMSGDIGFFDKKGSLSVVNRKKEVFKYKTYHVNPAEIEEVILSIDGVTQVAVIGIPNPEFQYVAKAVVVRGKGYESLNEQDIIDHVAERMPIYKQLHGGVAFMEELPMTFSGKVKKRVLVEQFTQ